MTGNKSMTVQDDLVAIQVTFPVDHCGDVIGVLSAVGGWIDHGPVDSDPSKILARVPKSAIFTVQKWPSEMRVDTNARSYPVAKEPRDHRFLALKPT
jgi:hypothetical protein